jgi:Cu+-exporting ATPase
MAQLHTHEITVLDKGIHCEGCEARIQSVLARMPGVQQIEADYKTQKVRLSLDIDKVSIQDVKEMLEDLGYSAE